MDLLRKYILIGLVIVITFGMTMTGISCTGTNNTFTGRRVSAYGLTIQFPQSEKNAGTLTVNPGETVILPVNVKSLVDIPISIRVIKLDDGISPDFIKFHGNDEYTKLQPSENVTVEVTCIISDNATPGLYQAALKCELEEPVPGRGESSWGFQVYIKDKLLPNPTKNIPAYGMEIQFPGDEKGLETLTIGAGKTAILPVIIRSMVDVPISVRIKSVPLPYFITMRVNEEYTTLAPSENITLDVTYIVSGNATPGLYQIPMSCELKDPVPNRPGYVHYFHISINNQ